MCLGAWVLSGYPTCLSMDLFIELTPKHEKSQRISGLALSGEEVDYFLYWSKIF